MRAPHQSSVTLRPVYGGLLCLAVLVSPASDAAAATPGAWEPLLPTSLRTAPPAVVDAQAVDRELRDALATALSRTQSLGPEAQATLEQEYEGIERKVRIQTTDPQVIRSALVTVLDVAELALRWKTPGSTALAAMLTLEQLPVQSAEKKEMLGGSLHTFLVQRYPYLAGSPLEDDPEQLMAFGLLYSDAELFLALFQVFPGANGSYVQLAESLRGGGPDASGRTDLALDTVAAWEDLQQRAAPDQRAITLAAFVARVNATSPRSGMDPVAP